MFHEPRTPQTSSEKLQGEHELAITGVLHPASILQPFCQTPSHLSRTNAGVPCLDLTVLDFVQTKAEINGASPILEPGEPRAELGEFSPCESPSIGSLAGSKVVNCHRQFAGFSSLVFWAATAWDEANGGAQSEHETGETSAIYTRPGSCEVKRNGPNFTSELCRVIFKRVESWKRT